MLERFSALFSFADAPSALGEVVSGQLDGQLVHGVLTRDTLGGAATIYRPAD